MALHKPEHKTIKYWFFFFLSAPVFVIVFVSIFIFGGWESTRSGWLRDWENYIDDPIDYCKEWLHCRRLPFTNYQINISFLFQNRETTWDIIRKHGKYDNCDPED